MRRLTFLLIPILGTALTACATAQPQPTHASASTHSAPAPHVSAPVATEWSASNPGQGCAVGSARVLEDEVDMAEAEAAENARAKLAAQLESSINRVYKRYRDMTSNRGEKSLSRASLEASINKTSEVLRGTPVKYNNDNPQDGDLIRAQVCLRPDAFLSIFENQKELKAAQAKNEVMTLARDEWDKLENMPSGE